ncbi:hypothetical protein B0H67DRAFT_349039 [Lasiosphaeris hirsuta]|uniref:Uncharacterized protein n=1 Tax=Lasiosphaeris hirsuta TaxID=260670 RepID=A0AA39ZVN4_9PEZI|nr:hypothetical protein B0H67DRAFT_349039 [Lasiosphaeris hirsuta]
MNRMHEDETRRTRATGGVYREPRRTRRHRERNPEIEIDEPVVRSTPYPRWLSLAARTSFTVIDVAALAQVVYVLVKWGTETKADRYTPAILNAGIALILDASVTGALILNKYGTGGFWLWSWFLDAIIVGIGFFSFFLLVVDRSYSSESSNGEPKPWKADNDVAAWLQLVIAIIHALASLGGCVGCCLMGCGQGNRNQPQ